MGGLTADRFADAVAEKGQHLSLQARIFLNEFADVLLRLRLVGADIRLEFDVKFRALWPPSIDAGFRASRLLDHAEDARVRQQFMGN